MNGANSVPATASAFSALRHLAVMGAGSSQSLF